VCPAETAIQKMFMKIIYLENSGAVQIGINGAKRKGGGRSPPLQGPDAAASNRGNAHEACVNSSAVAEGADASTAAKKRPAV
jgi:hypothetical protein